MTEQLAADLAGRLREAHRRVARLDAAPDEKARLARRLVALSDTSKHDLVRASVRLDRFLAELEAVVGPPEPDSDAAP